MTEDQVRDLVRKRTSRLATRRGSTGLRRWCKECGVAVSHVSEFLNGKRSPCSDLLAALNLEYRICRRRAGTELPTQVAK